MSGILLPTYASLSSPSSAAPTAYQCICVSTYPKKCVIKQIKKPKRICKYDDFWINMMILTSYLINFGKHFLESLGYGLQSSQRCWYIWSYYNITAYFCNVASDVMLYNVKIKFVRNGNWVSVHIIMHNPFKIRFQNKLSKNA